MSENYENIKIRDYTDRDYQKLTSLWKETGLGNPERGDNKEIIAQTISLGGKLFIVTHENSDEIIGTAWITFDGRRLHLHHFGISPKYQKKGLGKLLVKECLLFAKEKGYQMKLEVHKDNIPAIKLYKKHNFKQLNGYEIFIIRNI